ncbi:unnamed protein product [Rhizophagus irregularis]|nr:unnamed protein product [Rhizophagus irregularis]
MASSTNVRKEISRLYNVNSGITDEEFSCLLAYIVVNPNKVADIEECLKYGNDRVRLRYLRTLLSSSMFSSMLNYIIWFANNNTYLFLCFSFLLLMIVKNIRVIVEQSAAGQGDFPNLDSLKNIIKEVVKDEVKDIKNDVREIKNEVRDIKNELSGLGFKIEQDFNKLIRAMDSIDLFTRSTYWLSTQQDLRLLVNNPKYSDIEILLCEDGKKLHGCRAILAARSEVFDRLFYNGMKESYENKISFPKINSAGMEIILEYIYTGSVKEESLTKDNTVEAFYAAVYFQLSDLQDFIFKTFKNTNFAKNYSPELLSKISEKMPFTEDNVLLNLLVEAVANISLNNIKFGRLSITGLKCLLSYIYEKEKPFATPEYEVFRYSAILAAKQVSNDAHKTLTKLLPTLEQIENPIKVKNKFITDHQKVGKELEPLIKFIDFRRIKVQILANIIEPLEIVPDKIISNAYRYIALSNNLNLNNLINTRGTSINEIDYVWTFKWDVIIKKNCSWSWVGECASKNFDYQTFAGNQPTGWVFGSGGLVDFIIVLNGKKYREVSEWNNLPSKIYPVVSLCYPGLFRILSYQKNLEY